MTCDNILLQKLSLCLSHQSRQADRLIEIIDGVKEKMAKHTDRIHTNFVDLL